MKKYFPINLDINNKKCVVVGSGEVGKWKAKKLIEFGAKVVIVEKNYSTDVLDGAFLVVAATNKRRINKRIAENARTRGILVNAVDQKRDCDYISPAILEKKGLMITVSTHGKNARRSKKVRDELKSYRFKS